jgi:hypothetical protein
MKWGWDYNRKDTHEVLAVSSGHGLDGCAVVRVNMYQAMNGKIIEIHTPVSAQRHSDWNTEHMVLQDGENLHEMVATLLLAKGIK